jgi:hypothetical protein
MRYFEAGVTITLGTTTFFVPDSFFRNQLFCSGEFESKQAHDSFFQSVNEYLRLFRLVIRFLDQLVNIYVCSVSLLVFQDFRLFSGKCD